MAISPPNLIQENSAGTPGLWNSIFTRLWLNDLSLSGGTVGQSSNTLNPESGNTIFATSSMFSTADLRTATFFPAAVSGTPTWGSTQAMSISGTAATATLAATATALANARTIGGVSFDGTANITVASATGAFAITGKLTTQAGLAIGGINALFTATGITPTFMATGGGSFAIYGAGGVDPAFALRRVNGTYAVPTQTLNGNNLGVVRFGAYVLASNAFSDQALIRGISTEDWTTANHGAQMIFQTTPNGSATAATILTLGQNASATFVGVGSFAGLLTASASLDIVGGGTFTTTLISTTAQATLGALSATQFSAYASTVSGATLQGYGTTGDVTLKNRAGNDVLYIGPNTLATTLTGTIATVQPSANGAGLWKLGKKITAASAASLTQYLEVDVDGTVYKVVIN